MQVAWQEVQWALSAKSDVPVTDRYETGGGGGGGRAGVKGRGGGA